MWGVTMNYRCGLAAIASVFIVISLTSCWMIGDPGYELQPTNMQISRDGHNEWIVTFDHLELQATQLRGLTGEWWLDPHLTISTRSEPVVLEKAELITAKGSYPATIKNHTQLILPFSDHETLAISWRFSETTPMSNILLDNSRIELQFSVAGAHQIASITYQHIPRGK